jgi:hypothetical protein
MNNWLVSQKSGLEKVANQDTKTFDIEYTKWVKRNLERKDAEIKFWKNHYYKLLKCKQ